MNVLLGLTGTVASIKCNNVIDELATLGDVRVVLTENSRFFVPESHHVSKFYYDGMEWTTETILHIDLAKWADIFVVILDMNTLSKFAYGLCDNLLTSIFRAWDKSKPVYLVPAANPAMYVSSQTWECLSKLEWCNLISPSIGKMACGDVGLGRLNLDIKRIKNDCWRFPLENKTFIPTNGHPGSFLYKRSHYYHSGVDLYCNDGDPVYAVEDGVFVCHDYFTGPKLGHTWWEETYATVIKGKSGYVLYGEIYNNGRFDKVKKGQKIGRVKRVLPGNKRDDVPHHSTSMLHLELYSEFQDFADIRSLEDAAKYKLLDPTKFLERAYV